MPYGSVSTAVGSIVNSTVIAAEAEKAGSSSSRQRKRDFSRV
ncbi:MAG: hypothetical protein E1N59_2269 [Puniceicoccaceae bacterium 5H]|nr:MAG: hypothetical protein E1N59_2269 [Puniceicoccaceae bacterium 5H]